MADAIDATLIISKASAMPTIVCNRLR